MKFRVLYSKKSFRKLLFTSLYLFVILFFTNVFSIKLSYSEEINNINLSFVNFTILDKNLINSTIITDINKRTIDILQKEPKINFIKEYIENLNTNQTGEYKIITSDEVVDIANIDNSDIVLSGSITKLNQDIIINIRFYETVSGKVVFSKQYFSKDYQIKNIFEELKIDFSNFIKNINNSGIKIFTFGTGNSNIKIKSLPTKSKVSVNGIEVGETPVIIKNIAERKHLIESWREEESKIKEINIYPEDEQVFQVKSEDKIYTENSVNFSKFKTNDFEFEIIANPFSNDKSRANDLKYDNRKFRIEVLTEPENVPVTINDKEMGFSPIIIDNQLKNKYKVKLSKKRTFIFKKYIDTSKTKNANVDFNLFRFAKILISTTPSGAEIIANGEKAGISPKTLELPIGEHNLEFIKDGFLSEFKKIELNDDKIKELNFTFTSLKNSDTTTAFFPTGLVENTLSFSSYFLSLGQYTEKIDPPIVKPDGKSEDKKYFGIAYITGGEINYGIKDIFSWEKYINIGVQGGVFYNNFGAMPDNLNYLDNIGGGLKIQLIKQNEVMPLSLAIGTYYDFLKKLKTPLNSYIAITRDLGSFSAHLAFQFTPSEVSALNLGLSYESIYRVKISANALINFTLLTENKNQYITPLLGLSVGYNFL